MPSSQTAEVPAALRPAPGEHLWMMGAAWRVDPTEPPPMPGSLVAIGPGNMLALVGPGCYLCEREYSPQVAATPCPGEPSRA